MLAALTNKGDHTAINKILVIKPFLIFMRGFIIAHVPFVFLQ